MMMMMLIQVVNSDLQEKVFQSETGFRVLNLKVGFVWK